MALEQWRPPLINGESVKILINVLLIQFGGYEVIIFLLVLVQRLNNHQGATILFKLY